MNNSTVHDIEVLRDLPNGYAMIQRGSAPSNRAMIFVHGFNGDPVDTWLHFQELVDELAPQHPAFQTTDLFFYKYPSFSTNIPAEANRLLQFIRSVFPKPQPDLIGQPITVQSREGGANIPAAVLPNSYSKLVLVGHSMGCVLIRAAMTNLFGKYGFDQLDESRLTENDRAIGSADVYFFAPAHLGFAPTGAAGFFYEFIQSMSILSAFCKPIFKSNPVHKELEPQSVFLKDLRQRTERLARAFPWATALRATSAFGSDECIVQIERYDCDRANEFVPEQTHQSICKPTKNYQFPLRFVNGSASSTAA